VLPYSEAKVNESWHSKVHPM